MAKNSWSKEIRSYHCPGRKLDEAKRDLQLKGECLTGRTFPSVQSLACKLYHSSFRIIRSNSLLVDTRTVITLSCKTCSYKRDVDHWSWDEPRKVRTECCTTTVLMSPENNHLKLNSCNQCIGLSTFTSLEQWEYFVRWYTGSTILQLFVCCFFVSIFIIILQFQLIFS